MIARSSPTAQQPARNLILDPETLLIDNRHGIEYALKATFDELHLPRPEGGFDRWSDLPAPLHELFPSLIGSKDQQRLQAFAIAFAEHFHHRGRYLGRLRNGSDRLLASLAADSRFEPHYLTHIGMQAASRLLDAYGIERFLRRVVTLEQPACPGLRLMLLKRMVEDSTSPRSSWCLMTDHPWELMAAQDLGIRSIALTYSRAPLRVLSGYPAEAYAVSVEDVEAQLFDEADHGNVLPLRRAVLH